MIGFFNENFINKKDVHETRFPGSGTLDYGVILRISDLFYLLYFEKLIM